MLAGVVGALGSVLSMYVKTAYVQEISPLKKIISIIVYAGTIFSMLYIQYPHRSQVEYIKMAGQLLVAAILYGGILEVGNCAGRIGGITTIPMKVLLIRSAVCIALYPVIKSLVEKALWKRRQIYPILLEKNHLTKGGYGLLDTGNRLVHPRTREPVMVVEHSFIQDFFDEKEVTRQKRSMKLLTDTHGKESISFIPFCSVGKENGLLPAIRFEHLRIECGKKQIHHENVWIAYCDKKISSQGEYQMILHSDSIKQS